ncbi:MAG TPA: MBL fold metallo-hydrolase [Planctomycetota bacterium]
MERLDLAGLDLRALSVGGLETCFWLPRWKVALDIGRCPLEVVDCRTVLFTHAHMDHLGGIAYHTATRALRKQPPPVYVVPPHCAEDLARLFAAWRALDRSDMPHECVVIGPGEEHRLANGMLARPFASPHSAPCQGYGIWSQKEKLKPEFHGLEGRELARLRRAGVALGDLVETPELVFTGDARIEVVEREEVVRRARVLLLECTFVDGRVSVEEARAKGHVHLDEIAARAELFRNEAILLTHFSARYRPHEVRAALAAKLPPELLARVTPLLGAHARRGLPEDVGER